MLFATIGTATCLGDLTNLYCDAVIGENIIRAIMASTIYVHTVDVSGNGKITSSDFVLFKLLQMQKVRSELGATWCARDRFCA